MLTLLTLTITLTACGSAPAVPEETPEVAAPAEPRQDLHTMSVSLVRADWGLTWECVKAFFGLSDRVNFWGVDPPAAPRPHRPALAKRELAFDPAPAPAPKKQPAPAMAARHSTPAAAPDPAPVVAATRAPSPGEAGARERIERGARAIEAARREDKGRSRR